MPLKKGSSKTDIDHNIKVLVGEGKPVKQAIAISYNVAGKGKKKKKKNKKKD
jgi:hypothetical protein